MSLVKTMLEKIRKTVSIIGSDRGLKTNEFTQYSNDRFLRQELPMLYDEQQEEAGQFKKALEKIEKEALRAYEEGNGK